MPASPSAWIDFDIPISGGSLRAKEKGSGGDLLLCFHGYRENRHAFDHLLADCPENWRIVCLDLPLFGESKLEVSHIFYGNEMWEAILDHLLTLYPASDLHLLGFSMGGKIALVLQGIRAAESIWLLAPDGIRRHPLHAFASSTLLGAWLFRKLMNHPSVILSINSLAYRLRLITPFLFRFIKRNFSSDLDRKQLSQTVYLYDRFQVDWKSIQSNAKRKKTRWHLIYGANDSTFSQASVRRMVKRIPSVHIWKLDIGHMLVRDQWQEIKTTLDQQLFAKSSMNRLGK